VLRILPWIVDGASLFLDNFIPSRKVEKRQAPLVFEFGAGNSLKQRPPRDCVRIRTPLYHPDFPYILFWSQKAGCTTVVKWFFAQLGLLEAAQRHSRWIHNYEQEVFKNRDGYRAELADALASGQYKTVKIVRNPLARAASAFLILGERGAIVTHRKHWVQAHWDKVDDWLTRQGKDPSEGISFLDHLAFVKEVESQAPHSVNRHVSQQYVEGETRLLDEVVPIERFAAWTRQATLERGVKDIDLDNLATSFHHHKSAAERTEALGARPEATPIRRGAYADGLFPSNWALVNERSIPLIREVYQADFAAYGAHYPDPPETTGA